MLSKRRSHAVLLRSWTFTVALGVTVGLAMGCTDHQTERVQTRSRPPTATPQASPHRVSELRTLRGAKRMVRTKRDFRRMQIARSKAVTSTTVTTVVTPQTTTPSSVPDTELASRPAPAVVAATPKQARALWWAAVASRGRVDWHADGYNWLALAKCETGGNANASLPGPADWHMHGSVYSSAFGVVNEGVRQYASSPESAQRILNGTASPEEQLAMAVALERDNGIGGWGCAPAAMS